MIGDTTDFIRRLVSVLPAGWFSDDTPVATLVLSSLSAAWAAAYDLISQVTSMTRIGTSSGQFLDLASTDFFGSTLSRRQGEEDGAFTVRIKRELFRPRGTRAALQQAIKDVTGRTPFVVEPSRPSDTGGYAIGGVGYNQGGAWGSLRLNHRFFITAYRPQGGGIAHVAGYGTGGPVVYGNLSMVNSAVSDLDIYNAGAAVLPLGSTAWMRITN